MHTLERNLAAGADPLAWDALSDLCEERGDVAGAELWRRRAACLRAVLRCRDLAADGPGPASGAEVHHAVCPGWKVSAYCTRKEVRAVLWRSFDAYTSGHYHLPRASLLGQTQRSPKVAALYLRRKAFEWAEVIARPCRLSPCQ